MRLRSLWVKLLLPLPFPIPSQLPEGNTDVTSLWEGLPDGGVVQGTGFLLWEWNACSLGLFTPKSYPPMWNSLRAVIWPVGFWRPNQSDLPISGLPSLELKWEPKADPGQWALSLGIAAFFCAPDSSPKAALLWLVSSTGKLGRVQSWGVPHRGLRYWSELPASFSGRLCLVPWVEEELGVRFSLLKFCSRRSRKKGIFHIKDFKNVFLLLRPDPFPSLLHKWQTLRPCGHKAILTATNPAVRWPWFWASVCHV